MGSTWKCSAGALQVPSAGLHAAVCRGSEVRQLAIGLGETHSLAHSPPRKATFITADVRDCSFRSGIWVSRRKMRRDSSKSENEFGHCLDSASRFCNTGCLSLDWSQRFAFTSTWAHDSNGSGNVSPESPRFDSEGDADYAEKRRSNSVFQEYGKNTGEGEVYGDQWQAMRDNVDSSPSSVGAMNGDTNGGYMKLSRDDSNASDLFREGSDSVWSEEERVVGDEQGASGVGYESWGDESEKSTLDSASSGSVISFSGSAADSLAIGGKEPIYQVLEIHPDGDVVQREVSRRQLLRKIAGLRLRDIRSVDPSLWVTNSVPAILVRDQAILLNLGSLRAIGTSESVLIFEHRSVGAEAFMAALLPRLRTANNGPGPITPFELETRL